MLNPLVSVYILAFNSEKYLDRSLQSVINQTYANLEILVVINGKSSDNTLRLAESYQLKDSRIRIVINNDDTSISGGRKFALDHIKGDYFSDLDHDDIMPYDAIETLLQIALKENADIVSGKCLFLNDNNSDYTTTKQAYAQQTFTCIEYIKYSISRHDWMMHGKLYASCLYKNNKINITSRLYCSEDILIHYQLCSFARKIVEIEKITYVFIKNKLSSSHNLQLSDRVNEFNTFLYLDNFMAGYHNNYEIMCSWRSLRLGILARDLLKTNGRIYKAHKSEITNLLTYMDIIDIYNGLPINKRVRAILKAFKKGYAYGLTTCFVTKIYASVRD